MVLKVKKSYAIIVVILLIMTVVSSNLNWGKDHWKGIIESDGKGYYAYLPAVFIYHDLNFGFFDKIEKEKYYDKDLFYDYRISAHGQIISKYYCGTALAQLPFFLMAHSISYLCHFEMDGYSKWYPIFISIGALIYLFIGLIYLNRIMDIYSIEELYKCIVLLTSVFGTHLFYYTVGEPGMSHIYSFTFVTMFIYYAILYFRSYNKQLTIILASLLGVITLIRPINGLIVFTLPFLAGHFNVFKTGLYLILKETKHIIFMVVLFIAILSIQFLYYKLAIGHVLVYSYGSEGFNFLAPHMIDILFSYKKGLFLYTPIFLLSLIGTFYLWRTSKYEFFTISSFLILIIYIFSSWWMWYYGGSFSSRVFVEYIALFMILLAIALNKMQSRLLRRCFIGFIFFLIILCQVQTYQYRYYVIHWSDMTKEKYWHSYSQLGF